MISDSRNLHSDPDRQYRIVAKFERKYPGRGKDPTHIAFLPRITCLDNSNVFAAYFENYYPAKVVSAYGCNGYVVKYLSDNVVKNAPFEAIAPLRWIAVADKCLVDGVPGVIAGVPDDLDNGLFTVSLSHQNGNKGKTKL
ncbi:unnamed protein product [Strongylus vulgaris]|uniref:Hsr-9 Tudor domain-containing protein n=1 Tax=Strongylus vulgaris TaxID=40348 RepID=A0A3P7KNG8_STRVU|nr:unnamed protein product [Strongylus vulgaris]